MTIVFYSKMWAIGDGTSASSRPRLCARQPNHAAGKRTPRCLLAVLWIRDGGEDRAVDGVRRSPGARNTAVGAGRCVWDERSAAGLGAPLDGPGIRLGARWRS